MLGNEIKICDRNENLKDVFLHYKLIFIANPKVLFPKSKKSTSKFKNESHTWDNSLKMRNQSLWEGQ